MEFEPQPSNQWPRLDIIVMKSGELVIRLELAELRSEYIEITVEGDSFTVKGTRPDWDAETIAKVFRQDIPRGPFEVTFQIPPGFAPSTASANYLNGVLRIVVPRNGILPHSPRFATG